MKLTSCSMFHIIHENYINTIRNYDRMFFKTLQIRMIKMRILKRIIMVIALILSILGMIIFVERFFWIFTDKRPIYDFFVSWPIVQTFRHSPAWLQLVIIFVIAGIGVFYNDEVHKWLKNRDK